MLRALWLSYFSRCIPKESKFAKRRICTPDPNGAWRSQTNPDDDNFKGIQTKWMWCLRWRWVGYFILQALLLFCDYLVAPLFVKQRSTKMHIHISQRFCRAKIRDESKREWRNDESFYMPIPLRSAVVHFHALMLANSPLHFEPAKMA